MRRLLWLVAGCYDPTVQAGSPCVTSEQCPGDLACIAGTCGGTERDAEPPDGDPPPDGAATDCWSAWKVGPLKLSPPTPVAGLATIDHEADPWLSPDGLTIYFIRGAPTDVFRATGADRSSAFGTPVAVTELSSLSADFRTALTGDGLVAVLSSQRVGNTDLLQATRTSPTGTFGTPSTALFAAINDLAGQFDPEITADGLRIYYAPQVTPGAQEIRFASRPTVNSPFAQPTTIAIPLADTFDPTLSPVELVMVFNAGNARPFYATRASRFDPFGPAVVVPDIDAPGNDMGSALSADGCELFFETDRNGTRDVFVARVE